MLYVTNLFSYSFFVLHITAIRAITHICTTVIVTMYIQMLVENMCQCLWPNLHTQ